MSPVNQSIIKHKMGLRHLAEELPNVSQACAPDIGDRHSLEPHPAEIILDREDNHEPVPTKLLVARNPTN